MFWVWDSLVSLGEQQLEEEGAVFLFHECRFIFNFRLSLQVYPKKKQA